MGEFVGIVSQDEDRIQVRFGGRLMYSLAFLTDRQPEEHSPEV